MVKDVSAPSFEHLMRYLDAEVRGARSLLESVKLDATLKKLFDLIVSLCPVELFVTILSKESISRTVIERKLEREIITHPELDIEVEPKYLIKSLTRCDLYDKKVLESKLRTMLLIKTFLAFLNFFDDEFGKAFFGFRWILQFLHEARKIPGSSNINFILSLDYERSLSLLCARSLMKEFNCSKAIKVIEGNELKIDRLDILEGLLANILDCTEPSILTCIDELDYYMMDEFFTVIGEMEEIISMLKGPICEFESTPGVKGFAVRPQRTHVDSMIRKYILASTFKLDGDNGVISCMSKILEGILLYGGIHLAIITFFFNLRKHYISNCGARLSRLSPCHDLTNHCVDLVEEIMKDCEILGNSETILDLQCPQVLLNILGDEIIMVDEVYDESGNDHNHDLSLFLSAVKLKTRRKWYGSPKIHGEYSQAQWQMGLSWVKFWENCYLDNIGPLPRN